MATINTDFIHPEDVPFLIAASQQTFLREQPLKVHTYDNAVICPNGKDNGLFVADGCTPPPPQDYCDEEVVYIGILGAVWGHEITDHLGLFWYYFSSQHQALKNLKIVFTDHPAPHAAVPIKNFWALLETIGIPREQFHLLETPTRFARIHVPDPSFVSNEDFKKCYYTPEYLALLKRLPQLPAPPDINLEKIYLSRIAFNSLKDFNEKDIEKLFQKQGFTIIYPERLDFLTELAILQNCKLFASTDGSIAHNLLFCKDGTPAIICRKSRHFTVHQLLTNVLKNLNVTYIDAAFSTFLYRKNEWWDGPFFLYESNALRRFFGLPPKRFPFGKFFKYFLYYLNNTYLVWTHPIRAKLKIGTRLRRFLKKQ